MHNDIRSRLAALRADPSGHSDHAALLLAPSEVRQEPVKWLKYLAMDRVGLEPIDKIAGQIARFRLSTVADARRWLYAHLAESPSAGQMCVLKIVPWEAGAQLRNYRVFGVDDIDRVLQEVSATHVADHELWCCASSVSRNGFNVGGRLTVPAGDSPQVCELIWYASPRLIETVSLPECELPYLRATRRGAIAPFEIDVLHIPEMHRARPTRLWRDDFQWIAEELLSRRASMRLMVDALRGIGASEVCFCFKVSKGRLTVIDWDTELESTVR